MENTKLLIDTSIIIDFLRKKNKSKAIFWEYIQNYDCYISTITHFELFCGANSELKRAELNIILNHLTIVEFDKETSLKSAEIFINLKKRNNLIEFRDIFIASTAIMLKIPLSTLNIKHFNRIEELDLLVSG